MCNVRHQRVKWQLSKMSQGDERTSLIYCTMVNSLRQKTNQCNIYNTTNPEKIHWFIWINLSCNQINCNIKFIRNPLDHVNTNENYYRLTSIINKELQPCWQLPWLLTYRKISNIRRQMVNIWRYLLRHFCRCHRYHQVTRIMVWRHFSWDIWSYILRLENF